jgi:hypothetical protein
VLLMLSADISLGLEFGGVIIDVRGPFDYFDVGH